MMMHALMAIAVFLASASCEKGQTPALQQQQPQESQSILHDTSNGSQLSLGTIVITTKNGPLQISVEIAKSDAERAKGLMGRESLPANNGMWFVFPQEVQDPFWMKDTSISLDIIFVGKDFKVVDMLARTTPQSTELLFSKAPYQYVLEVNAGFAEARGIQAGDVVEFRVGPR